MTIPNNVIAPLMDVEAVNVMLTLQDPTGHGAGQGSPYVPCSVAINAKSTGSTLNVGTAHALQYSLNNGGSWTDIVGWTTGSTVNTTLNLTLAVGNYPLWVRAMDQLGTISAVAKTSVTSNPTSVTWAPLGVADGDVSLLNISWAVPGYEILFVGTKYPSGSQQTPPDSILGFNDAYGFSIFPTQASWGTPSGPEDTSEAAQLYQYAYPPGWPSGANSLLGPQFNFFNTNPH